ncbi:hypothetical protein CSHISOI_07242 [Colletotrichum shisoi]|uniref:Uncharacterized protein n=1 Tax=Colletotrichum shisoi TaxID=2078593 RepID=A0A5Q4BNT0_9PEZI|nr:hypothetical protein CSHISOI_07242 [Colletotrichum shisoi]
MQQHATWRRDEASRDAVVVMQVVGVMLALGPCVRPIASESPFDHWIPFDALAPSICPDASHGPLVVIPRAAVAAPPPHLSPLLASWDWEAIKNPPTRCRPGPQPRPTPRPLSDALMRLCHPE